MDKLFIAIQQRLKDQVPQVKAFDWDNGQLDGENQSPPTTPIVLMDIDNIPFGHAGHMMDMGEMQVKLKCGFRVKGRSDSNAPELQQQTALQFLSTLQNIGVAVTGLTSENTSGLQRENLIRIQTDELKVYEYTFGCTYYERGNLRVYDVAAWPPLEVK